MKKLIRYLAVFLVVGVLFSCAAPEQTAPATDAQGEQLPAETTEETQQSVILAENDGVSDPANYQFAVIYGGDHPFFYPWAFGAKAAAKDLGIPEPFIASPQAWDQTEQNQVIDSMIDKGAKGIAMFPSDAAAGNSKITKLVKSGIPCVTMGGSPLEPSDAVFCYATDVGASVALGTQELINKLRSNGLTKGNIVHLCSSLGDTNTKKRQEAIKRVLARPENAGFVLYLELSDTDAIEPAEKAISTMFSTYINQVDGIICTGYVNAQVLAKTMVKLNERRVVAIGIDDSQDVLSAIDKGIMYGTMTQNPWGMGYVGIYALKLIKDGYHYKGNKPFFINSGYFLLTKEGLSSYQQTIESNTKEFVLRMQDEYFEKPRG
jgi:ribose transport system substrate-binding protein